MARTTKTSDAGKRLTILGIDPGLASVGMGVIEHVARATRVTYAGDVKTPKSWSLARRLKHIHDAIREVARKCKPDAVAIEKATAPRKKIPRALGVKNTSAWVLQPTVKPRNIVAVSMIAD